MDIHELVEKVADGSPVKKDFVASIIKKITKEIIEAVTKGEAVHIRGLGRFMSAKMAARTRRNPRTGLPARFPATTTVKFHPSPKFRASVAAKITPGP